MTLTQWQRRFLRRLVELGGSISVPAGVMNEDLLALIEFGYLQEKSRGSQTSYTLTKKGRLAIG
jgi:hypothetical protein